MRPPGRTEFRRQRWEEGTPPRSPESPVAPRPHPSLPPRSLLRAAWRLAAQSPRSWRAGRSSVTRKPSTRSIWEPGTRRAGALTFLLGEGVRSTSMDSTLLQTVKHGHGPGYDQGTKTHAAPRADLLPAAAEHQGSSGISAPRGQRGLGTTAHPPKDTEAPAVRPKRALLSPLRPPPPEGPRMASSGLAARLWPPSLGSSASCRASRKQEHLLPGPDASCRQGSVHGSSLINQPRGWRGTWPGIPAGARGGGKRACSLLSERAWGEGGQADGASGALITPATRGLNSNLPREKLHRGHHPSLVLFPSTSLWSQGQRRVPGTTPSCPARVT